MSKRHAWLTIIVGVTVLSTGAALYAPLRAACRYFGISEALLIRLGYPIRALEDRCSYVCSWSQYWGVDDDINLAPFLHLYRRDRGVHGEPINVEVPVLPSSTRQTKSIKGVRNRYSLPHQ